MLVPDRFVLQHLATVEPSVKTTRLPNNSRPRSMEFVRFASSAKSTILPLALRTNASRFEMESRHSGIRNPEPASNDAFVPLKLVKYGGLKRKAELERMILFVNRGTVKLSRLAGRSGFF